MANNEINAEKIIDGKIISSKVLKEVSESIIQIKSNGLEPCLAVVLVGNDPASSVYVRNKKMMCEKVGIKSIDINLDERISEEELLDIIINLNKDKTTNGILVQFPLPSHIDKQKIINTISPDKDVDGLHPINAGRLMNNVETLVPCTPQGCMIMLRTCLDDLSGKNAIAGQVTYNKRGKVKDLYKTYNISLKNSGNDIGSMQEVIKRRFSKIQENSISGWNY